jgi:hypothetical protein
MKKLSPTPIQKFSIHTHTQTQTHTRFAEREGFEPPEACTSTVFKTAAIDHSAISPGAKVQTISNITSGDEDY